MNCLHLGNHCVWKAQERALISSEGVLNITGLALTVSVEMLAETATFAVSGSLRT